MPGLSWIVSNKEPRYMEPLSYEDLIAFRERCLHAVQRGQLIARADEYVAMLSAEATVEPPAGTTPGSAAHLYELATEALANRPPLAPPVAVVDEPKPVKALKPVVEEPPPVVVEEPKKVEEVILVTDVADATTIQDTLAVDQAVAIPSYEAMNMAELRQEAQAKDIAGRSSMSKAELVAALEEAATAPSK